MGCGSVLSLLIDLRCGAEANAALCSLQATPIRHNDTSSALYRRNYLFMSIINFSSQSIYTVGLRGFLKSLVTY